ncbi:hypothetical protein TWF970_001311 [Orbilia oligospora]|nr:hypothetical protein TWF970_001311 [Orbilia oligospora]
MEFPARDSIEQFVMTEGYQEQPTTAENVLNVLPGLDSDSKGDEILAEPLGGIIVEREFNEIFPRLTGFAPVGPFIPSAVREGNTADPVPECVPPYDAGDRYRAGGSDSPPLALAGSLFVAEPRAPLLEEEYEDVAIVAASSAGGRYWGGETSSVPQDSTGRKPDGSFRWPGIDY